MKNVILSEAKREIVVNNITISYTLLRKKVKNLNLRVRPDSSIVVSAPKRVSVCDIDSFVIRKIDFIERALNSIQSHKKESEQRHYVSGEGYRLEGKNLRLKVIRENVNKVESDGVFLALYVNDPENVLLKEKLIKQYYAKQVRSVIGNILDGYYEIFKKYDIVKPQLKFRTMKTRWGSCNSFKAIITINNLLIEAPMNCIEYVVMHELCHMIHPNHSQKFYAFLSMLMPDWKERKNLLNDFFCL